MDASPLDNPFWSSLRSRHRKVAVVAGDVARYPPEFAPFLGVAGADVDADAGLASLVQAGETAWLLGVAPRVGRGWRLEPCEALAQMVCDAPAPVVGGPPIAQLDETDRAEVLALTQRVYPHYFRQRTLELGRYFGIRRDGRLAAMIGERLGDAAHTELSAICTHPAFTGRGHAHRLVAFLTRDLLARGQTPFLHVSHRNPRALKLYADLGYRIRAELSFWSLRRA